MTTYAIFNIGCMPYSEINMDETHEAFMGELGDIETEIKAKLKEVGMKFVKFEIFVPSTYNYSVDSLDIVAEITNKKKLIAYIKAHSEAIQKLLDKNKSYDGYIATTPCTTEEAIDDIKNDKGTDTITLKYILGESVDNRRLNDILLNCLVYEPEEDDD